MIDDTAKDSLPDFQAFQAIVWDYYQTHGRHDLPWRSIDGGFDAYRITVSEVMLQQTQVNRAIAKYAQFIERFPTVPDLAEAPLGDVLRTWSGLGYNRRAQFLWRAAQQVVRDYDGVFPARTDDLVKLPGIGPNTAGAILAYAYDQPAVFVETNIRTVFIHHFFHDRSGISDGDILELVAASLDPEHPREWYWALMDYGAHLKRSVGNLSQRSKAYSRQSTFAGSRRQVRGHVLRLLAAGPCTLPELRRHISDERLPEVLDALADEGLIYHRGNRYGI